MKYTDLSNKVNRDSCRICFREVVHHGAMSLLCWIPVRSALYAGSTAVSLLSDYSIVKYDVAFTKVYFTLVRELQSVLGSDSPFQVVLFAIRVQLTSPAGDVSLVREGK